MDTILHKLKSASGVLLMLALFLAVGCKEDAIEYPEPVVYMTFDEKLAYVNEELSFKNLSEYSTAYQWDFGDGTSSTEMHPTHTYTQAGEFTITLTGSGDGGEKKEKFTIVIAQQTLVGNWSLANAVVEEVELPDAVGTFKVTDATNYSATFLHGNDKGTAKGTYTLMDGIFLSNIDGKVAITNGTSASGTSKQILWETEIFCAKNTYNAYVKYGLGIDKPQISIVGRYMYLTGNGGKTVLKYQKD